MAIEAGGEQTGEIGLGETATESNRSARRSDLSFATHDSEYVEIASTAANLEISKADIIDAEAGGIDDCK
jgi:hypothetical protein